MQYQLQGKNVTVKLQINVKVPISTQMQRRKGFKQTQRGRLMMEPRPHSLCQGSLQMNLLPES